jgi:hypothetical protein
MGMLKKGGVLLLIFAYGSDRVVRQMCMSNTGNLEIVC